MLGFGPTAKKELAGGGDRLRLFFGAPKVKVLLVFLLFASLSTFKHFLSSFFGFSSYFHYWFYAFLHHYFCYYELIEIKILKDSAKFASLKFGYHFAQSVAKMLIFSNKSSKPSHYHLTFIISFPKHNWYIFLNVSKTLCNLSTKTAFSSSWTPNPAKQTMFSLLQSYL